MPENTRAVWVGLLDRVARPVLLAAAEHRLKRDMPVEQKLAGGDRAKFTHLEALGRTLTGLAPFLELAEEPVARDLAKTAVEAIHNCFNPASPDVLDFTAGGQVIVDAAFLSHAFLRAPTALWARLDAPTQDRVIKAFTSLRTSAPHFNNWLLFSAITEAFLKAAGQAPDPMRVDYALRQHEQWYIGGGWYKDGPNFHHDYYNSFVIQPMLLDTARFFAPDVPWVGEMFPEWKKRAQRFADTQERLIASDGSYPVTGRSMTYRCGAFQLLAHQALANDLPATLKPGQIRNALTKVIRRTLEPKATFDANGWLTIGLSGHQPGLGETYISTGSLYLCTAAFLPLGLPAASPFWTDPELPTTWDRAWSGEDLPADHD